MAKSTSAQHTSLYKAAERYVEAVLRGQDSLFTPGVAIWTKENVDQFHELFVKHPDTSADSFEVKLQLGAMKDEG